MRMRGRHFPNSTSQGCHCKNLKGTNYWDTKNAFPDGIAMCDDEGVLSLGSCWNGGFATSLPNSKLSSKNRSVSRTVSGECTIANLT